MYWLKEPLLESCCCILHMERTVKLPLRWQVSVLSLNAYWCSHFDMFAIYSFRYLKFAQFTYMQNDCYSILDRVSLTRTLVSLNLRSECSKTIGPRSQHLNAQAVSEYKVKDPPRLATSRDYAPASCCESRYQPVLIHAW